MRHFQAALADAEAAQALAPEWARPWSRMGAAHEDVLPKRDSETLKQH